MDRGGDDMTGNTVKKKIQKTRLFSDAEKIELLVRLDELTADDQRVLEETIDGFDATYVASVGALKDGVQHGLAALNQDLSEEEKAQTKDAVMATQLGLGLLSVTVQELAKDSHK